MDQNQNQQQMQIKADEPTLKGHYANAMMASHSKEEFVLDFLLMHTPVGQVVSRIITSPGHLKRIIAALQENLKIYEQNFGGVEIAEEPKGKIGF